MLVLIGAGIVLAAVRRDSRVIFCAIVGAGDAPRILERSIAGAAASASHLRCSCFPPTFWRRRRLPITRHGSSEWVIVPAMAALTFVSTFVPVDWGPAESAPRPCSHRRASTRCISRTRRVSPPGRRPGEAATRLRDYRLCLERHLSDSLLAALEPRLHSKLIWNSHVDLRDRFRVQSLTAEYVVVGTPTPTHLRVVDQQVITVAGGADPLRRGHWRSILRASLRIQARGDHGKNLQANSPFQRG